MIINIICQYNEAKNTIQVLLCSGELMIVNYVLMSQCSSKQGALTV